MRTRDVVRIEIRAAAIAQAVWSTDASVVWDGREMAGWMYEGAPSRYRHLTENDMADPRWQAGNLAAQIWYHRLDDK